MSRKPKEKKDIFVEEEIPVENLIPEENVLSLRKKEWVIRIDPKQIKDFLYLHKHTLIFIFTFFATCAFIIGTSSTNASVATFYPGTCLGGWQNVENATGEPSVDDVERIESFTKENSAIFENSNEEIFCGDFKGVIPEDTEPKKFTLAFHWSFDYGDIKHDDPLETNQEIKIKEDDSSSDEENNLIEEEVIEEKPTEDIPEVKEEIIEEPKEELNDEKLEEINEEEPKTEETTSIFKKIFSIAHAQEEASPSPEPEQESEPVSEAQSEPTPEPEPQSQVETQTETPEEQEVVEENQSVEESAPEEINSEETVLEEDFGQPESAQGGSSSSDEDDSEEDAVFNVTDEKDEPKEEDEIETSPNDIFEVVYTLDGETWDVLGRVRKDKWKDSTFEIPYEKINTWDELSKLQVRLKVLPSFDVMPIVYLDAVSLSVEYIDSNLEIKTIDFENIVHTVDSKDLYVFLAKKEGKYGIWVLEKSFIGKPEESLRELETVGVLPYEPAVKDGIIFWVVGDPQTVVEEIAENIVPESVNNYLDIESPQLEVAPEIDEIVETLDLENPDLENDISDVESGAESQDTELPIETIDALENDVSAEEENGEITEVLEGQNPTAIVGFREDIGYISQTILDTNNKDNWLKFGDYAIAWKAGSFLIFDMVNSTASAFDSISINKNTPNILPKMYREWIVNIPEFEEDEKELEVIDSEKENENDSSVEVGSENDNAPTEEVEVISDENTSEEVKEDEIEVINVDEPKEETVAEEKEIEVIEESNPELSI